MRRNNTWRWVTTAVLVAWALFEIIPPSGRDLIATFKDEAINQDPKFQEIVARAEGMQKTNSARSFGNLRQAVGTNNLQPYFVYNLKDAKDPNEAILNEVQRRSTGKIKLGLDLQGGVQFLVNLDTNQVANVDTFQQERILGQAVEVLRARVDKFGVAEPVLQPVGANRILIQMPGLSEADKDNARKQIERAAFLEFRLVHAESDKLLKEGRIPPGYELLTEKRKDRQGKQTLVPFIVARKPANNLTGKYIQRAMVTTDPKSGRPEIMFEMKSEGAGIFAEVTRQNIGRQLAIVLDGELQSAPNIESEIPNGSGRITLGNADIAEAYQLAAVLENPLEAPVNVIEERTVDPSLGSDSVQSGIRATIYGVLAVAAFMMIFYFFAGAIANFALMLNILITLGTMCSIGATLTLPGIAGLVLSVGMAVDANVLIFERIREELAAGKSLNGALEAGYRRAFGTIFDSHVTTLISAIILIFLGTGPIKGFGVMLTIGVAASLFTALVVTRLVFDFLLSRGLMTKLHMMTVMRLTKIDFLAMAKPAFILSILLIVGGLAYGIAGRGQKMLGVDFAGGDSLTMHFSQKVNVDSLRDTISKLGVGEPTIQYQKPVAGGRETLQLLVAYKAGEKVENALRAQFPQADFKRVAVEKVGPTVGMEIQRSAVLALSLAMVGIFLYVALRYEFSFAVAAVVATAHDALITIAVFALAGGELSSPVVAAIMTVIGYSINDKIVILDRIREDLKLGIRGSFRDLINLALNQTLSRTLITGGSVILATLSLYIFGGGVINDFAFTFLVGIFAGTYSSIYIASAIVLWWHKGERPQASAPVVAETAVPARA